jgi:hypothetical protein
MVIGGVMLGRAATWIFKQIVNGLVFLAKKIKETLTRKTGE